MAEQVNTRTSTPPWGITPAGSSFLRDLPIVLAGLAVFYGIVSFAHYGIGPMNTEAEISLAPGALPKYALYSVIRIAAAYALSLVFTLIYGYIAAYNKRAERLMIPLLDTLQSIPVLSFLPGVMVAMVSLFPTRQLGVELGSILLIFTGQVWNMTFSFYSSLKNIPREMREASRVYHFSWFQRFVQMELPYASIGLIWNSMMSVAGGWFFLMACEMFVLGDRDLRLPGLGSYLQTAANEGKTRAILAGVGMMILVIVLMDQLIWRPVIAWAQKFKVEQVEAAETPTSPILELLRRSHLLSLASEWTTAPARERLLRRFAQAHTTEQKSAKRSAAVWYPIAIIAIVALLYGIIRMFGMIAGVQWPEWRGILLGAGATFLRVEFVLLLAALWTVPVGIYIGLRPRLSAIAQPIAQIAASVPATALFPIVLLVLIRLGGGLGIGAIVLLLLGTQWYILFNVIAGATAIPTDLKEVCSVFRLSKAERWRRLFLPAVFPYLVTGFVTASGGAWNASIVAEYFHFHGETISTVGLGAVISDATNRGNFHVLLAATVVMALMVVAINRLVWRPLYSLASTKYKLEA